MTLKEKVTDLCKQSGISVRELERRAGLKERTIQHWDESEPSAAKVYAVANALNVPLEELLSVYHPEMDHLAYIESMKNKEKPATNEGDGLTEAQREFSEVYPLMTDQEVSVLLSTAKALIASRKDPGD